MKIEQNAAEYCVVMITVSSEAEGKEIAMALLTEKLAACINIYPVNSFYTWSEKINSDLSEPQLCRDREWQLMIKTRADLLVELSEKIGTLHSYDVPEFIALPVLAGSTAYLNWIGENTKKN